MDTVLKPLLMRRNKAKWKNKLSIIKKLEVNNLPQTKIIVLTILSGLDQEGMLRVKFGRIGDRDTTRKQLTIIKSSASSVIVL